MVINVHEAKTHLSRLLQRVSRGEVIVIGRNGRPVAKLVPYEGRSRRRSPGAWKGRVQIAADFDDLPGDLLDAFEGRDE